jgi:pSer/pThr/pTyr-binding forkhead associated (FHA) protein
MPLLIIASGDLAGKQFELGAARFTIGRSHTCSLVLDMSAISGEHCAILRRGSRYAVQDAGSTNGTLLNGVPVREALLKDGDRIGVGSVEILFQDPTGSTTTLVSSPAFAARKSARWKGVLIGILVGLAVLLAAVWFAIRLING